jgi:hypothetical protein
LRLADRPSAQHPRDHPFTDPAWRREVELPTDARDTLLSDWETFLDETLSFQTELWWQPIVPSVRAFALASLEQGLGLPRPSIQPADRPLPEPGPVTTWHSLLFTDLSDINTDDQQWGGDGDVGGELEHGIEHGGRGGEQLIVGAGDDEHHGSFGGFCYACSIIVIVHHLVRLIISHSDIDTDDQGE